MDELRSPDRLVTLASLGVRCVQYIGHDGAGGVRTLRQPIAGLEVRVRGSREVPTFHPHSSVYGFCRQEAGPAVVEIVDPLGRYLERTVTHTVDGRIETFRRALERGGSPATPGWQPVVTAALLPAARTRLANGSTGVYGTVRDGGGEPLPYAFLEWQTGGGHYRTRADRAGDYFVRLVDARSGIDAGTGRRDPHTTRDVTVWPMRRVPAAGDLLRALPDDFEALRPGTTAFDAVWDPVPVIARSISLEVGTLNHVPIG